MKRIISISLILTMLISLSVFANDESTAEEINSTTTREEKILSALGIDIPLSSGDSISDTVTRAQAAGAIVTMLGYDTWSNIGSRDFFYKDVPAKHSMAKSIYTLSDMGIMKGDEENFRPDDALTFNETLVSILRVLGYDAIAEAKGGFANGYIKLAGDLKLMKGVETSSQSVNRSQFAKILYNALEAPIADTTSFVGEYEIYDINDNNTFLSKYIDGEKAAGIVEATSHSSLQLNSAAPQNCVIIDGTCYYSGKSDAELYMGYGVIAYAKLLNKNDNHKTIVYFETDARTDILKINKKDVQFIAGFDSSDENVYKKTPVLKYVDASNKSGEIKITSDTIISYNGIVTDAISNADFTDDVGEIVFIDTNNTGKYDYIAITSFKTYIIDRIDLESGQVFTKDRGVVLTLDNSKDAVRVFKYGKKVDINALRYDDAISVAVEKLPTGADIDDSKIVYIYASTKMIESNAESINNDESIVMLGGVDYDIFPSLIGEVNLNITQKFYFDVFNNICAIDAAVQEASTYGYFLAFAKSKALSQDVIIRFYEFDEETHNYYIADHVKYTGPDQSGNWVESRSFDRKKLLDILNAKFTSPELVKFNLNEEGKICRIIKAKDMESIENYGGFSYEEFTLEESAVISEMVIQNNMLTESYRMDKKTTVVIIPKTGDVEDYVIGNGDTLYSVKDVLEDVKIYDSSDSLNAGVVIATISSVTSGGSLNDTFVETSLFVVEKVVQALDDDEIKYKLTGMIDGSEKSYLTKDADVKDNWKDKSGSADSPWKQYNTKTKLSELSFGDVVLLQLDASGKITSLFILFSYDDELPEGSQSAYYDSGFGTLLNTCYGKVTKNYKNKTLRLDGFTTRKFAMRGNLYFCNLGNKTLRKVSPQEITDDYYAFIRSRKNEVKEIVIFRK